MSNNFNEVKHNSNEESVKTSFLKFPIGVFFIISSIASLWINEYFNILSIKKINLIKEYAIEISSSKIDRNNDDRLISTNGSVYSNETLKDTLISVNNALVLQRTVEMYQWNEIKHSRKKNRSTKYSYKKIWSNTELNSDKFKNRGYRNPKFYINDKTISVNKASMGDFKLNQEQLNKMTSFFPITLSQPQKNYIIHNNYYYKGRNPMAPEIGDIRISYKYVPNGTSLSIIGQQKSNNTISKLIIENVDIYTQYDGSLSLDEIITKFKNEENIARNMIRFLCCFTIFVGLNILTIPIKKIASYVPFIGNIVEKLSVFIMLLISIVLTLISIVSAWLFYRPLFAGVLIALIILVKIWYKKSIQQKNNSSVQIQ